MVGSTADDGGLPGAMICREKSWRNIVALVNVVRSHHSRRRKTTFAVDRSNVILWTEIFVSIESKETFIPELLLTCRHWNSCKMNFFFSEACVPSSGAVELPLAFRFAEDESLAGADFVARLSGLQRPN